MSKPPSFRPPPEIPLAIRQAAWQALWDDLFAEALELTLQQKTAESASASSPDQAA